MHHPGARVEHGLHGRLSDEDGTARDVVDPDRSTRSERRGARGRLRNADGRKEGEEPAAEAALGYQPQDSGMAVIQLQVHACGPAPPRRGYLMVAGWYRLTLSATPGGG